VRVCVISERANTDRDRWSAGTCNAAFSNTGSWWATMTLDELSEAVRRLLREIKEILGERNERA
jgi:hypothetical protein